MSNIEIRLTILHTNGEKLRNAYKLSWDSSKKSFEVFIVDLMNTIQVTEEPGLLDSIVIDDIIVTDANKEETEEINLFKKDAGLA